MTDDEILEGLKQVELDLLKAFIDTANKLGLKYYLMGGTMLGAVRHSGFIPWDDDIDVGMMRSDYEIWQKEAPKLLDCSKYFVQTIHNEPEYLSGFSKLRNSSTTFIEKTVSNTKINHGVYIDVFPLDYYPEKASDRKKLKFKKLVYEFKIQDSFCLDGVKLSRGKHIRNRIIAALIPFSAKKALLLRDRLFASQKPSSTIANYYGAWGAKEICPKEWFGDGTTLKFEGMDVTVPEMYGKWLTKVYGDYMTPPPAEKRIAHHFAKVIDLEKPYTYYFDK